MNKIGRLVLWTWAFCIFAFAAYAENFYIENYEVMLDVSKGRNVHVKEVITAYFTTPSHGIIRNVPTINSAIEDVRISEPFTRYYEGGEIKLKIGHANEFVSGQKVYQIEYNHQIYSNKNEFYYNLIGTGWGVPIKKVRFYVKMPDKVEDDKVGFSIGSYGTRGFEGGAEFSVEENQIWGQTFQSLPPHHGITLRVEVPEGYFANTQSKWVNFVWLGLLFCTLFSFLTWYQYGKDEHVTPIVTFKSPENITPADAELILTEKISDKGLIALIVKLANDGYFKIKSEKSKFTLSDFKDYAGSDRIERDLLDLLQQRAKNGTVTDSTLKNSSVFYNGWNKLRENAITKDDKNKYYEKSSMNPLRNFMMCLYMAGNILLTIFSFLGYSVEEEAVVVVLPFAWMFLWCMIAAKSGNIFLFIGIFLCVCASVPMFQIMSPINPAQVLMGVCCFVISWICYVQMLKPNVDGRLLKGKLLGLKHFIKVAEKKRLETMVEQNPQYFYKILPYAYVLGVSSVWIKQFEGIAVPPPEWAVDSGFRLNNFNGLTRGFQTAIAPSVANGGISQSSSHSSSFGGGGFSGGGFGGGGGSSW